MDVCLKMPLPTRGFGGGSTSLTLSLPGFNGRRNGCGDKDDGGCANVGGGGGGGGGECCDDNGDSG